MPLRTSVIRAKAKGNDVKRRLLLPPGFRIFFLKRGGETSKFTIIREVTKGANIKYSDWRQQFVLNVATLDETFDDDAAQTSYWSAGVGYGTDDRTFDVYVVDPQRRDVVPPTANNAAWKFFLTRDPKASFVLPEETPAPEVAFAVTDCGLDIFIGDYIEIGTHNSKPYYTLDGALGFPWADEVIGFYWGGSTWALSTPFDVDLNTQGTQYFSSEDVAAPSDVVTWEVLDAGVLPLTIVAL